jgi:hypothetical protein
MTAKMVSSKIYPTLFSCCEACLSKDREPYDVLVLAALYNGYEPSWEELMVHSGCSRFREHVAAALPPILETPVEELTPAQREEFKAELDSAKDLGDGKLDYIPLTIARHAGGTIVMRFSLKVKEPDK